MGRPKTKNRIRLACESCDREDFDGIDAIPDDWEDVTEVQSYEDSIAPLPERGVEWPPQTDGRQRFDGQWWTHLGTCPECQAEDAKATGKLFA